MIFDLKHQRARESWQDCGIIWNVPATTHQHDLNSTDIIYCKAVT